MATAWKVNPNASVPIPCPKCGKKQTVLVRKLRANPKLTCTCGHAHVIEGKQLDMFMKALEGFGR